MISREDAIAQAAYPDKLERNSRRKEPFDVAGMFWHFEV
jgi:hypothetical protein